MKNDFMSFPFNIPSSIFRQIVAQTPGIYQISNPWNWGGTSLRTTIVTPTRVALDMEGEGLVAEETVSIDMDVSASWDIGLGTDYTVAANRQGLWFYIHAYSDGGVIKYLLSDIPDTLNTAVLKYRAIERLFCYASGGVNHVGQVVGGVLLGDVDIASFESLSGASVTILSGDTLPSVFVPETFFYNTLTASLHFSMGNEWITISEQSKINDFDFMIGSISAFGGEYANIPTGMLGCLGQTLLIEDYQKLYANIGITNGGDGITNFKLPDLQGIGLRGKGTQDVNGRTKGSGLSEGDVWEDEMQKITGDFGINTSTGISDGTNLSGAFVNGDDKQFSVTRGAVDSNDNNIAFDSSQSPDARTSDTTEGETHATDMIVDWVIYVGSGGLSEAIDGDLDRRVTALENQPVYAEVPYDTGWIANSDWTFVELYATHGFDSEFTELDVKFYISSNGTEENASQIETLQYGSTTLTAGLQLYQLDKNTVKYQTGVEGIYYIRDSDGNVTLLGSSSPFYYKIVVTKRRSVSFIDARNAFINHKDWVESWNGSSYAVAQNEWYKGDGDYKVYCEHGGETMISFIKVSIGNVSYGSVMWGVNTTENPYQVWVNASNEMARNGKLALSGFPITKISRWQDTTGASKPAVPLDDGWEVVYDDIANTSPVAMTSLSNQGTGMYMAEFWDDSTLTKYTTQVYIDDLLTQTVGATADINSTNKMRLIWTRPNFSCDFSGWTIRKMWKFKGVMALDINHTRELVTGTPNHYEFSLDTNSGDVDATAYLPSVPVAGDKMTFYNAGTGVYHITNLPGSIELGARMEITYTWRQAEGLWSYDRGTLIDYYTFNTAGFCEKYAGGKMRSGEQMVNDSKTCSTSKTNMYITSSTAVLWAEPFWEGIPPRMIDTPVKTGGDIVWQTRTGLTASGTNLYVASNASHTTGYVGYITEGNWKDPEGA